MTPLLPRIAIPEPTSSDEAYNQRSLPQYLRAVEAAGGVPVPIALHASPAAQADLVASCSAILLPGSPADVNPERYGQDPVKECGATDEAREAADNLLLQDAFAQCKPILGICYGLQSLNVWRHGSLIQHLPQPESSTNVVNHAPGRTVQDAHLVRVAPDSRLSSLIPGATIPVNSSHHQAIDRLGEYLTVVATSPADGVIEALEGTAQGQFVIAVQWHPERSYEQSATSRALFAAFVEAARAWKPSLDFVAS